MSGEEQGASGKAADDSRRRAGTDDAPGWQPSLLDQTRDAGDASLASDGWGRAIRIAGLVPAWLRRQSEPRRRWLGLLAGALSALAFAPVNLLPLMPLALAVLVWLIDGAGNRREAARLGWWFSFGQLATGLYWIALSFQYQSAMPPMTGVVAVILLAGFLALYGALAAAVAHRFWSAGPLRVLVLAIAWVVCEGLRGHLFTGFPWNLVGNSWLVLPPVAQAASVVGAYGLSFLMVLAGGAVALLADGRAASLRAARLIGLLLLAVAMAGAWRLLSPAPPPAGVPLYIIQANIAQDIKWDASDPRRNLREHLELSDAAMAPGAPGLVIWPETAIPNIVEEELSTRYLIARHVSDGSLVLMGGLRVDRTADGLAEAVRNSLLVIDPEGRIQGSYDKAHLVPFGEYLPFRSLLEAIGIARLAPGDIDFVAGPGARTLALPGYPAVGPMICYEAIFPGAVADRDHRPDWLLNVSNDAWFGLSAGPHQHLASARLRAIEEGLPLVRSTPTGISAVIDAKGRLTAHLGLGERGVLKGVLPGALPATLYSRFSDWPLLILLTLTSVVVVIVRRRN